ncbi:YbaB/EbfC family nucleoid-associated protein [Saccharopolyspora elongata]|uniref:YbaB/EbfC family DNA-binding protein n=1 Tax=Saccharopolyspora elongata TaxID=2530387 RepID=A0A4R4YCD8_9PSEU|nr:YbaB/EbfC family nucleoid-associated protein [Saccharopolyspora elongata]TDD42213.1 YbaB/EbfC family DNA-binding protein [Saccharopolyspora elongata]
MSSDAPRPPLDMSSALQALEEQQAKLAEFQHKLAETTTRVESPDRVVAIVLDGQAELREIKFLNTDYRTMAPAELGEVLLRTIQQGRAKAAEKVQELLPAEAFGDVDLHGLACGEADLGEMLGQIMRPALEDPLGGFPGHRSEQGQTDDGWDRTRSG